MSLFKTKSWWSNDRLQSKKDLEGTQNGSCVKVDRFSNHSDSDCIIVGEENLLKIYKPNLDEDASQLLLETQLSHVVVQVETGKFTAGAHSLQILLLHPQSYAIYDLQRKEGHTDAGEQNALILQIRHSFTRKSHSLVCGHFGQVKTRDLICVQGLDGTLSFFDQDTFMFMCVVDNVIIPGPIDYVASSDNFVLCKSTWVFEIYSYQQLRDYSELSTMKNKKNIPQWLYPAGEEISALQVLQTSSNFSSILALGERFLYCFQDNGLMKFMKKFDYMPVCFYAYLIGWFYEPGSRLLVMIASDDSKLYIYEGTTLLWSCQLPYTPISLSRCFIKYLPGGIVTLSIHGIVNVSYLGTEPDLSPGVKPMINENTDPVKVQTELKVVEEKLQKILRNDDISSNENDILSILKISADTGKPVQNLFQQFTQDYSDGLHLLMCPIIVMLSCEEPKYIKAIQITYYCSPPLTCTDSTICLDSINGTEIIESNVFLSNGDDISDATVQISITVTDSDEKILVLSREVVLPASLYCTPTDEMIEDKTVRLCVETNMPCVDIIHLFPDFSAEDLRASGGQSDCVRLLYRGNKKNVTTSASNQNYYIDSCDFCEMTPILESLIFKLNDHFTRMDVTNLEINVVMEKELWSQILHRFLKGIEAHAKERIQILKFEDELNVLQKQFTLIQKRLLVQYGSSPPGDCEQLEFLMKDTHRRIANTVNEIITCKLGANSAVSKMAATGQLIIYILKTKANNKSKIMLLEEIMSFKTLYEDFQCWEESVSQGLTYALNNIYNKTEKEKEKMAPITEQGVLSHINLKRFLKQLRFVLDSVFTEICRTKDPEIGTDNQKPVTRIEELVEVI